MNLYPLEFGNWTYLMIYATDLLEFKFQNIKWLDWMLMIDMMAGNVFYALSSPFIPHLQLKAGNKKSLHFPKKMKWSYSTCQKATLHLFDEK